MQSFTIKKTFCSHVYYGTYYVKHKAEHADVDKTLYKMGFWECYSN